MSAERPRPLAKHIIIEVGTGAEPFPTTGNKTINDGEYYVGVESNERLCMRAKTAIDRIKKPQIGETDIVWADARKLPLVNESVSEVIFCNVFGDLRIYTELDKMVKESLRVLKEDGMLVVVETLTPRDASFKFTNRFLKRRGFEAISDPINDLSRIWDFKSNITSNQSDEEWYGAPYIALFQKNEANLQQPLVTSIVDRLLEIVRQ